MRTRAAAIEQAKGWAHTRPPFNVTGMCLKIVRTALGVPAAYQSAEAAWYGAKHRHDFDGNYDAVPRGVAFFWTNGHYGHVVLSLGGDLCVTNDVAGPGTYTVQRLSTITARWGQRPRGWVEDLNGVRYFTMPPRGDYTVEKGGADGMPGPSRSGPIKFARKAGFDIRVVRWVYGDHRWWGVTEHDTYYMLRHLNRGHTS